MYEIEYEPRVEDPVVIATFSTLELAEEFMDTLRAERPKAAKYHTIKEKQNVSV
tara:strand:- start:1322 stop:1483 length:162 start_codon:yes stop_codon:yes gene_type:complete